MGQVCAVPCPLIIFGGKGGIREAILDFDLFEVLSISLARCLRDPQRGGETLGRVGAVKDLCECEVDPGGWTLS